MGGVSRREGGEVGLTMIRCQSFAAADALAFHAHFPSDFGADQLNSAANETCLDIELLNNPWENLQSTGDITTFGDFLRKEVLQSCRLHPLQRPRRCKINQDEWDTLLQDSDGMFTLWRRVMFGDLWRPCKRYGCNASLLVYAVACDVTFKVFNDQMNAGYASEPFKIEPSPVFRGCASRIGPTSEVVLVNTQDGKWMSTRRVST